MSAFVTAGYKRRAITLWVEDETARSYLARVWQDNEINVMAAGGAVRDLVRDAGLRNVMGFVGRGFDVDGSNRHGWLRASTGRVLVSSVFEVANFLFDEDAIAGSVLNTSGRSAPWIAAEVQAMAGALSWWMACRSVIASLSQRLAQRFVGEPEMGMVQDRASAVAWIATSSWVMSTVPGIAGQVSGEALEAQVIAEERRFSKMLAAGHWKSELPGRAVLEALLGRVWTRTPAGISRREAMHDFAKAVADQQRKLGTVPAEVEELRVALRKRVGI